MEGRSLLVALGSTLLLLALLFGLSTLGATPETVQAAQATPSPTVQAANTPTPAATPRGTQITPTAQITQVIPLTPTGELDTQRTITVVGEGRVEAEPDQAQVTVGVETTAATIQEAVEENFQQMEDVIDALIDQGVAQRNIQTTNLNIFIESLPPEPELLATEEMTPTQRPRVIQQVSVTVTDLDNLGEVLGAALDAGANNIFGVNFILSDRQTLQQEARIEAMQDAWNTAQTLADLAGVELAGVVSISEGAVGPGPFPQVAVAEGLGGGGPPIQPGQLTFTRQVQVTFAIR